MKKKILVIGPVPPPTGGVATVMEQMMSFKQDKYRYIFVDINKNKFIKSNIIFNIINYAYNSLKIPLIALVKRPDIIHIHSSYGADIWQKYIWLSMLKLFNFKIIIHMHASKFKEWYADLNPKNRIIVKKYFNKAEAVIVLSDAWKEYYKKIIPEKRLYVVQNAIENINHDRYSRIYPKDEYVVLFLSTLCDRKGIYDLFKVIQKDKDQHTKYVFVGRIEHKDKIISRIQSLGIKDKCEIVGEVLGKERFKYFSSADLFVLPSYAEGLPIAMLEAMSFGLPIISTKVGAIPEVIKKKNGILIQPGDPKGLYQAITNIRQNKILANKISINNKKLVKKCYSSNIFKKNIELIYNTFI